MKASKKQTIQKNYPNTKETKMATASLFLKDIETEGYWENLETIEDVIWVKQYLHDVKTGPADGGMCIEFQEGMRGYYAHLEILDTIIDPTKKANYLKSLLIDIDTWLQRKPDDFVVFNVREMVASGNF